MSVDVKISRLEAKLERGDTPSTFKIVLEDGEYLKNDDGEKVVVSHHEGKRWLYAYQTGLSPLIPRTNRRYPDEFRFHGVKVSGNKMSDFDKIKEHVGKYEGGKALIVLGGESGRRWRRVFNKVKPDVVIGVNGVNTKIDLDYWIIVEGGVCHNLPSFQNTSPRYRLVHSYGFDALENFYNAIRIMRAADIDSRTQELEPHLLTGETRAPFDIRKYGIGLLSGDMMQNTDVLKYKRHRCGTVAVQAIHWAGILGVNQIHTVGLDLCFKKGFDGEHHWYADRQYSEENEWWDVGMFETYCGLDTSWFWIESGEYILKLNRLVLEPAGIKFVDHSNGLLKKLQKKQMKV